MAKQRNSLGVCVLPEPGVTRISWEEYQNRYGIDLSKIFVIYTYQVGDDTKYSVKVNPKFTKLLVIVNNSDTSERLPPLAIPNYFQLSESVNPADASIELAIENATEDFGHYIVVFADRTIKGGGVNE